MRPSFLAILCTLAFGLDGCGSIAPGAEEVNDKSIALHIVVESVPPGAAIHGVLDDGIGDFIGTTPFTCKYVRRNVGGNKQIFGTAVDQTIGDNLDFEALDLDVASPFFLQCWLLRDGYQAQRAIKSLQRKEFFNPMRFNTSDAFDPGQITVTVELTPSESD